MSDGGTASDRAARIATSAVFFLNGAGMASWVVRIPAIQDALHLGTGKLGVALLGVAAGALIAMPLAGRLVASRGSGPVTRATSLAFAAALALPPLAPSLALLVLALVVLGAANGALDVAMNAQASAVEQRYGRPIMSSFHALFSLGGLVGSAVGGIVAGRGVSATTHILGAALAIGIGAVLLERHMLQAHADAAPGASAFARPTPALIALGVVAFSVLFGEGAMADWSAVYLRDVNGAGPGLAAAGYASFSLAMATGRFVGDALIVRLGARLLVRGGGALAALGLLIALLGAHPWASIVGFGAVGAGLSNIFPTVLATAGRLEGQAAGPAIAAVSTLGYTGFLAGPPLIGFVAEGASLRGGLALVVVSSVVVASLAGAFRHAGRSP